MSHLDDFDFWCSEYRDNDRMAEIETTRLLSVMCEEGNPYAIAEVANPSAVALQPDVAEVLITAEKHGFIIAGSPTVTKADYAIQVIDEAISYVDDWKLIATRQKDLRGWRCAACKFQAPGSSLIHVHHIDGDKKDNSSANLLVVCAMCHGHQHGKSAIWPEGVSSKQREELLLHHWQWRRRKNNRGQP